MKSVVALILARGGSKGIPRKNLQEVAGRSLVYRAARACVRAEPIDRVFVYSDDDAILAQAVLAGAAAVPRPAEVSGDRTTSEEAVQRYLRDHDPGDVDLMLVQATSPFLRSDHVCQAVEALHSRYAEIDAVVSVFPIDFFLGYVAGDLNDRLWLPFDFERWRRQDHDTRIYAESGALYLAKRPVWECGRRMGIGGRTGVVVMRRWESVEIDDPEDLAVARAIAPILEKGTRHASQQADEEAADLPSASQAGGLREVQGTWDAEGSD